MKSSCENCHSIWCHWVGELVVAASGGIECLNSKYLWRLGIEKFYSAQCLEWRLLHIIPLCDLPHLMLLQLLIVNCGPFTPLTDVHGCYLPMR